MTTPVRKCMSWDFRTYACPRVCALLLDFIWSDILGNWFRHRSRSRCASIEGKTCRESIEKFVTYTIPPSVEAVMEKVVFHV
ncbi:unnamed protein product [Onchocerca flexuosa]|uniref:Secreted protein n=1 Tax=Onchocerca flexuosa TaxID=387005 RepID=A0A183I5H8_9BILA|nr:unnamed protein product [Onchocerca flexuosa]